MRFFELAQLGSFATLRSICPDENQSWSLLKVCFVFGGCWVIFITQVQRDMEGTTLFSTLWGVVLKHVHKTDFDRLILKCEHLIFWSCYRLSTVKGGHGQHDQSCLIRWGFVGMKGGATREANGLKREISICIACSALTPPRNQHGTWKCAIPKGN